ncbi:MAG: hypothetical protein AAGD43_13240 [Pseudomonadota bacterium]
MRSSILALSVLAIVSGVVSSAQAQQYQRHWDGDRRYELQRERSLYAPGERRRHERWRDARRRDHYRGYREDYRPRRRRRAGYGHYCLSRGEITKKLRRADLHVHTLKRSGRKKFYVIAHNSRKDRYDLTVSACKGDILTIQRTQTVKKRGLKGFLRKIF